MKQVIPIGVKSIYRRPGNTKVHTFFQGEIHGIQVGDVAPVIWEGGNKDEAQIDQATTGRVNITQKE